MVLFICLMLESTSEATWTLNAFCGNIFVVVTNVCLHVWLLDFYIFLITCATCVFQGLPILSRFSNLLT